MDLLAEVTDKGGTARLGAVVATLVAVALISAVALFGSDFLIPWLGQRVLARLRLQGFRALLDVHLAYFDTQRVGAIVSKLTNNIELLEDAVRGVQWHGCLLLRISNGPRSPCEFRPIPLSDPHFTTHHGRDPSQKHHVLEVQRITPSIQPGLWW